MKRPSNRSEIAPRPNLVKSPKRPLQSSATNVKWSLEDSGRNCPNLYCKQSGTFGADSWCHPWNQGECSRYSNRRCCDDGSSSLEKKNIWKIVKIEQKEFVKRWNKWKFWNLGITWFDEFRNTVVKIINHLPTLDIVKKCGFECEIGHSFPSPPGCGVKSVIWREYGVWMKH